TALSLPPSSLSLLLSVPLSNPHLMECIRGESCDQRRVSQNPLCFFLQLPLLRQTHTPHTALRVPRRPLQLSRYRPHPSHTHPHTHTHTHTPTPHTHTLPHWCIKPH